MNRRLLMSLTVVPALVAGCGNASSSHDAGGHVMSDGTTMSASMSGMNMTGKSDKMLLRKDQGKGAPSATARMICSPEIRNAIMHKLQLASAPQGLSAWGNRIFTCSYGLPGGGDLRLSVNDASTAGPGRDYYDRLRAKTGGVGTIKGLANFGFPAFESSRGEAVFLKDHKTLWVDATRLTPADLPSGTSRQDAAYGIAAAVIACWTE